MNEFDEREIQEVAEWIAEYDGDAFVRLRHRENAVELLEKLEATRTLIKFGQEIKSR